MTETDTHTAIAVAALALTLGAKDDQLDEILLWLQANRPEIRTRTPSEVVADMRAALEYVHS